jgi:hypothetical protein
MSILNIVAGQPLLAVLAGAPFPRWTRVDSQEWLSYIKHRDAWFRQGSNIMINI